MKGKLFLEKFEDNLRFSNGFEFKDGEYLSALENYEGFDLDVMLGKKEVEYKTKENVLNNNFNKNNYDNSLYSCECDVLDGYNNSLSCYDFFNIVYGNKEVKELTLILDYDSMDYDFEEEFQEWIGDSERLCRAVNVFGEGLLPKKDFYFELINDSNEKLLLLLSNTYLVSKESNKITVRVENISIKQRF